MTREPAPQAELDAYLQWYFERHPVHADAMGVPGHASRLGDFTAGGYEGHQRDVARWRSRLQAIDDAALSAEARIDRDLVVAVLGGQLLQARWPAWRRDPAEYLDPVFAGLDLPFLHRLAPETERVAAVSSRLGEVPEVLAACRHNLDPGLAAPLLVRRAAAQAPLGPRSSPGHYPPRSATTSCAPRWSTPQARPPRPSPPPWPFWRSSRAAPAATGGWARSCTPACCASGSCSASAPASCTSR